MATVLLNRVTKEYSDSVVAVDDINLEVNDREFLVLVGPSGCGKSTTLRLIAGLETCERGEIKIGTRVVNDVSPKDRDIAMVFQNYALYPHMSVYKNLSFGLELRFGGGIVSRGIRRIFNPRVAAELGEQRRGISNRVRSAAQRLGIEHLLKRKPHQLSGGERQRVALGRAIVRNPAAFLFDEPLSNLDAKLRTEMRVELKRLHRELEATMIYVTHDQVEAMTLGDRIAVMNGGKIQQVGPPLSVYRQPANVFVAGFIGSQPMNLMAGTIVMQGEKTAFRSDTCELDLTGIDRQPMGIPGKPGQPVTLGIRPEDVTLVPLASPSPANSAPTGSATVVAADQLGDATVIHLEINSATQPTGGRQRLLVKSDRRDPAVDEKVQFEFNHSRIHWFDSESGENLLKD